MLSTWPNLLARRDLVRQVTLSELKSSRLQTRFGWVWWLIDPVVMMLMYWGIVVGLMGRGKVQYAPYPIFILTALITWKHVSSSIANCSRVLSSHEALIKSVAFPTMVLPISRVLSGFTFFLCGMGVVGAAVLIVPNQHSGDLAPLVQMPALMALQLAIVAGCALVVACFGVLVKDLRNFLGYILRIGFYGSASLYGIDMVRDALLEGKYAETWGPTAFLLFTLNPFALLITGYRDVLFYGRFMEPQYWITLVVEAVVILYGGFRIYQHYDRRVIKFL